MRTYVDNCGIYYDLTTCMDLTLKEIIPGRYPWKTAADARRYVSAKYDFACKELADACGISVALLKRKHAPGVAEYRKEATAKFRPGY